MQGLVLVDKPAGPSSFAVVEGAALALRGEGGPRGHARSARQRAPARPARLGDATRALPRRARQALRDRDPARPAHDHRRRGGRGRRGERRSRHARRDRGARGRGRAARAPGLRREDRRRARLQAAAARRRRRDADPRARPSTSCGSSATSRRSSSSTCRSRAGRTSVRSPTTSAGTAGRSGARRSARSGVEDAERGERPGAARRPRIAPGAGPETRKRRSRSARDAPFRGARKALWHFTSRGTSSPWRRETGALSDPRRCSRRHEAPPGGGLPQPLARPDGVALRRPGHADRPTARRGARPRRRRRPRWGYLTAAALIPHLLFSLAGRRLARACRAPALAHDRLGRGAGRSSRQHPDRLRARRPHVRAALRGRLPRRHVRGRLRHLRT